jgi:hypothetical protein
MRDALSMSVGRINER